MREPVKQQSVRVFARDLVFGEGLRWHQDRLWISDMLGRKVYAYNERADRELIAEVPARPNGLTFLKDGTLLIASMADQRLLKRLPDGRIVEHAALARWMTGYCGDMAADARGRVYLDDVGYRVFDGEKSKPGRLLLVEPDGTAEIFDDALEFPNGMWLSSDRKRLIFAEGRRGVIHSYDLAANGRFTGKRVFAERPGEVFDGLTVDSAGGVWVCQPYVKRVIRLLDGGEVTHQIDFPDTKPVACCLGGRDLRTLFIVAADYTLERMAKDDSTAVIYATEVETAGFPLW